MKKFFLVLIVVALLLPLGISGCGEKPKESTTENDGKETSEEPTETQENVKNEDVEVSDLSEKVTIELMFQGWVNLPRPDDDPYQLWVNDAYNVDFVLNPTGEFHSEVLTRFASNDPPDLIKFDSFSQAYSIYEEGGLIDDWNLYINEMPCVSDLICDEAKTLLTSENGNLMFLTRGETNQNWSPKIRVDWLNNLGLSMPKTDDELLDVARKFTYDDPDQNGKDDTYGFSSAGNNESIGEIAHFVMMYGPPSFYINDNGEVSHPIIDGNKKKLLDFVKKVVDEKLIDPDWYTVGWEDRKNKLYKGQLGIMWYPGVIVAEIESGTETQGIATDWYDSMDMPKGADTGGKIRADGISYQYLTASKKAEENKLKMDRIVYIMEQLTYPNEDYWKLAYGIGIDNFELQDMGDYYWSKSYHPEKYHFRHFEHHVGVADWGNPIRIGRHQTGKVVESPDTGGDISATLEKQVNMDIKTFAMPKYDGIDQLLSLDQQFLADTNDVMNEFDIKYILGETTDYDGFVESWLNAGGQQLIDQATEQWQSLGLLE